MRLRGHAGFGPFGVLRVVRVSGVSMEPTLHDGDVLLLRLGVSVGAGDLVVADLPGGRGLGVKRVLRVEDDGAVFLERDNPREGTDSWLFGAVPADWVLGRVEARIWPSPGRVTR